MITLRHLEQSVEGFGPSATGTRLRITRKTDRSREITFHTPRASLLPRIRVEHYQRGMLRWQWILVASCSLDEEGCASALHEQLRAAEAAWAAFLAQHAAIAEQCCKRNWRARADYQAGDA